MKADNWHSIQLTVDLRIVLVFAPIVLALSWAGYNIGRAALGQFQLALRQYKKNTGN